MDESEYSNYFTCLMINTLSAGMVPDCSKAIDADKCFISFKHVVICLCLLRIQRKQLQRHAVLEDGNLPVSVYLIANKLAACS